MKFDATARYLDLSKIGPACLASLLRYTRESIAEQIESGYRTGEPVEGEPVGVDLVAFCEEEGYPGASEIRAIRYLYAVRSGNGFTFIWDKKNPATPEVISFLSKEPVPANRVLPAKVQEQVDRIGDFRTVEVSPGILRLEHRMSGETVTVYPNDAWEYRNEAYPLMAHGPDSSGLWALLLLIADSCEFNAKRQS